MSKLTKSLAVLVGAAFISTQAFAGAVQPAPVTVDLDNMFATGDMVSARTDKKNDETFIGCGTRNFETGEGLPLFNWAFCQANDGDGNQITCFTQNPDLVETIHAINDFSFITFGWTEDELGGLNCSRMGFSTQSFYIGKEVKRNKPPKSDDDE